MSIATLGLGMALGAGVALLCAPKSGRELRRQLFARLDGAGHEVEDLDEPSPSRAKEGSGRGRSNSRSDDLHPEIDA